MILVVDRVTLNAIISFHVLPLKEKISYLIYSPDITMISDLFVSVRASTRIGTISVDTFFTFISSFHVELPLLNKKSENCSFL